MLIGKKVFILLICFFLVPTLPENKYKAVWRKMNYFQYVPEEDENVKAMQVIDSSVEKLHTKLTEIQGELQGIEKVFLNTRNHRVEPTLFGGGGGITHSSDLLFGI